MPVAGRGKLYSFSSYSSHFYTFGHSISDIKDNCFKGREFKDVSDAKEFLKFWLNDIANKRMHGTIKKIPAELFEEFEKPKLKELPVEDFVFSKSSRANVGPNCHISYGGNYYSVPYIYIRSDVDVIEVNNLLKVYFKGEEIALHPLCQDLKGEHIQIINIILPIRILQGKR